MKMCLLARRIVVALLIQLVTIFLLDCKKSPTKPQEEPITWHTPRVNQEAEEAALWLSDSLVAPEVLYNTILNDLALIRAKYSEDISEVTITFTPPWITSQLLVMVSDEAQEQIRAGQYHDLDSLNSALHLSRPATITTTWYGWIFLTFEGRLNPKRLAELYKKMPSVTYAEPNLMLGDRSNVYPWQSANGVTYLFREAWGDCPSGCTENCWFYFEVTPKHIINYFGGWCSGVGPEPDWWAQAKMGMFHYGGG